MSTSTTTPVRADDLTRGPSPVVVGVVAACLAAVVGYGLSRYFATGCGAPDAKFACLLEGIVLGVAAPVVVPLVAWPLLRMAGVRRALLTALLGPALALALAYPAQQLVLGVHALVGGAPVVGASTTESVVQAVAAALALGLGAFCATLLLSGRVGWRAWVGAGAVVVLALGVASLAERVQDGQRLRADLASAHVPLLAPPEGWAIQSAYVGDSGELWVNAHPEGEDPYGDRSVDVTVSAQAPDSPCAYDACRTTPDGLVLVTSQTSTDVLTENGGAFVEVTSYDSGPVAEKAVLEVARGLRTLDVDAFADLAD